MTPLEVDIDEPFPWQHGLTGLTKMGAAASVVVEGLQTPVDGILVNTSEDGGLLLEQQQPGTESGTIIWVPLDRIVSVSVPYQRRDVAAERRA